MVNAFIPQPGRVEENANPGYCRPRRSRGPLRESENP
jgi:hypothetical protein